jgi:Arc/MetJ-type ribon-helix-helix transcriptional regulator
MPQRPRRRFLTGEYASASAVVRATLADFFDDLRGLDLARIDTDIAIIRTSCHRGEELLSFDEANRRIAELVNDQSPT